MNKYICQQCGCKCKVLYLSKLLKKWLCQKCSFKYDEI